MCAAHGTVPQRWEELLYGVFWLRFLRRSWAFFGPHSRGYPATAQVEQRRRWWGRFGNVLREIKA